MIALRKNIPAALAFVVIGAAPGICFGAQYQINALGTSQSNNGNNVVTTDWTLVFDDVSGDGLLQVEEIVSFSGTTVTTSFSGGTLGAYEYDTIVGTPDIAGISTSSGADVIATPCCWWFTGSVMADPLLQDGWYPSRWTYTVSGPINTGDADGDGIVGGADLCPASLPGDLVDANGCAANEALDLAVADLFILIDSTVANDARDILGKAQNMLDGALGELAQNDVKKALKNVANAVKELIKAEKEGVNVGDLADRLVEFARTQAQAAIAGAIAAGGNQQRITRAQVELARAEQDLINGDLEKAIDRFRRAWDEANKA